MQKSSKLILYLWFVLGIWILIIPPSVVDGHEEESLKVVVVGDTGIGERGYTPGFHAVQSAMQKEKADAILHLGDFVYQPELFPSACPDRYIDEIKRTLVMPYPVRIFVAGDNDLPPVKWKPKASGCWEKIVKMATPFDSNSNTKGIPGGAMQIGPVLFVVMHSADWMDPTPWLSPLIAQARQDHKWVVVAMHTPAVTTAWYLKKRREALRQINALGPDLVLAGNQHSYERFYPFQATPDETIKFAKTSKYQRGTGVTHMVVGGGGATFKPFADLSGKKKRSAPKEVMDALANRALMFHYLTLEIDSHALKVKTHRVCPQVKADESVNPRWKPDMDAWKTITLECEGKPSGVTVYDEVVIRGE